MAYFDDTEDFFPYFSSRQSQFPQHISSHANGDEKLSYGNISSIMCHAISNVF